MDYEKFLERTHEFEKTYWWFRGLRAYAATFLSLIPDSAGRLVLDAGCGPGGNYELVKRYGKVYALDYSNTCLRLARTYGLNRAARASITHIPYRSETFDLVTSFDVLTALEVEREEQAMAELFRVLKPGGYLLLNLAALMILWGKQDVAGRIKVRYDRPLLQKQLDRAGFETIRISSAFAFSFPALLGVRLADRFLFRSLDDTTVDGDFSHLPRPLNALLAAVASAEARLVRHVSLPLGSSLLALARRPR